MIVVFQGIREAVRKHEYEIRIFTDVICESDANDKEFYLWLHNHNDAAHLIHFLYRYVDRYHCESSDFYENGDYFIVVAIDEFRRSMSLRENVILDKLCSVKADLLRENILFALKLIETPLFFSYERASPDW